VEDGAHGGVASKEEYKEFQTPEEENFQK